MTDEITESSGNYGHAGNEWGSKDDSEKIEWEEHYGRRNGKWRKKVDEHDEGIDVAIGDKT
ncbi:protein of unknown function [Nitrosotalea devaniterrae]|uniref:Uncharacterized protein n=1 Tax=Nitrosotalea devaniterrae TaxID=1078905 RepID=A0A128A2U5_9ARCH|nr:protein of unknown function [Candidatus Nitrosotalea devanaterra]